MINLNCLKSSTNSLNVLKNQELGKNMKNIKVKNPPQKEMTRGRNTRQFGVDITNISTQNVNGFPMQDMNKKKALDRKSSNSTRDAIKAEEGKAKKGNINVPECKVDNSSVNLKMEICNNSFGGSSMLLDEPVMTRNQCNVMVTQSDPQLVKEYFESIVETLFELESSNQGLYARPYYMRQFQTDINDKMRVILFDWLVDVHQKWKLQQETLYLTFNLIDRFLATKLTSREELQCVGVAGLLIACKYEEIYFPELEDFREITDNTFSKQEILKKEFEILSFLEFNITVPSALRFFEIYNIYLKLEGREKYLCLFLLELSIFDYQLLKYRPSLIAASCLMLIISNNKNLKEKLFLICRHDLNSIHQCCKDILVMYQKVEHGSKSLTRKYSSSKFLGVGTLNLFNELS